MAARLGLVATYHSDITRMVLHRQVARWMLGRDTTDLDDLLDFVTEREHKFPHICGGPWRC